MLRLLKGALAEPVTQRNPLSTSHSLVPLARASERSCSHHPSFNAWDWSCPNNHSCTALGLDWRHKGWQEGWTRVQSLKHWAGSTAALISTEYADLTIAERETVELGKELIHYIPAKLEEKANSDFRGSAKTPCPTFTHYFSGHYEEGAHWRTKKLRNLKATSPNLCWTVSSWQTWQVLPQHQLSLGFTSFVSYFTCIKVQKE